MFAKQRTGLSILIVLLLAPAAIAGTYTENFSTDTFKDAANTTADWNTTDGELKLPPFTYSLAGSLDTSGSAVGVAVDGDHAFVADWGAGLRVIDISDPANPILLGSYDTPHEARDVAVAGNLAFVADGFSGLVIIDISDPTLPTLTGSYDTGPIARGVAVVGDLAFLATSEAGLLLIDISDPTTPALVSTYLTADLALGVAVDGDHAFVGAHVSGLEVVDISDPTTPTLAGSYDTAGSASRIAVDGNLAFVGDGSAGLQLIDISDPANPSLAGSYNTPGGAGGVMVDGNRAFVADATSGLQVIDISDPANPTLSGSYDTAGSAADVVVAGTRAFVADGADGLQVIRIAEVTSGAFVAEASGYGHSRATFISGNLAYVAGYNGVFYVVDILDPTAPVAISSLDFGGNQADMDVAGNHAFVSDYDGRVVVVDISDPTSLFVAGTYDVAEGSNPSSITIEGDLAFVGSYNLDHFLVLDISDPTSPGLVSSLELPGRPGYEHIGAANKIAVAGNMAFVSHSGFGLYVVDISDPALPAVVADLQLFGGTRDVSLDGDYAHLPTCRDGMVTVDISDPTSPSIVGNLASPEHCQDRTHRVGDLVVVGQGIGGFRVADLSDSANPSWAGGFVGQRTSYLTGDGDYLFGSVYSEPLRVYQILQHESDITGNQGQSLTLNSGDPVGSAKLATTQTAGVSWELSADGGANWQAFEPDGQWYAFDFPGNDLRWRSIHAWADENPAVSELTVSWLDDAVSPVPGAGTSTSYALHQNVPNPFNPSTTIRFELPRSEQVTIRIYDLDGRLVRALVDGTVYAAGLNEAMWNGRDGSGRQAASGTYFYRIEAGEYGETRRMVLVK